MPPRINIELDWVGFDTRIIGPEAIRVKYSISLFNLRLYDGIYGCLSYFLELKRSYCDPTDLREEIDVELEAMGITVNELLALQRDVAERESTVRENTAAAAL